ncbi:unnamed protein product [Calypogeia fissa]
MKAKASDSIRYDAYPGDCDWYTAGLSTDTDTFTKNRTVNCWQLTMGLLSRSGTIYSYERTKEITAKQGRQEDASLDGEEAQRTRVESYDDK